ncbi:hypothetical protein H5410_004366 [Solanum commersonii]|uniref:Uncharacterized protein n=1 Tax=Solanum commersonii TaxID=4109 RepID=A0A9J6B7K3_SOLCO|nr:hypothetical protein H5410_004366 [Solanum commersonii]
MASPSNLNLALIPFENTENLFELPVVMFIDPCGITHLAYLFMEEASIQGERSNQSLGSDLGDETIACDAHESLTSNPSVKALVRVTQSIQRTQDAMLLAKLTKKTRPVQKSGPKEIDEVDSARALSFRRISVIRSRVITGFGGDEMHELLVLLQAKGWTELFSQGTLRRRMGREETREFYLNATGSDTSISSTICGVSFTLTAEILSFILGVPNSGWDHYVKRNWLPLEGNISALEICH